MGDKTSDDSDDEFGGLRKSTDETETTKEPDKVSYQIMDSSGDESDDDKPGELPFMEELKTKSSYPGRKSSLHAKLSERRKTLIEIDSYNEHVATQGSDTLKRQDIRDQKLIEFAKSGKMREVMSLLVVQEANINSRDLLGNTGLNLSAQYGHLKIVQTFLDRGLDINTTGSENSTALIQASMAGETAVVKLLLDRRADIEHANKSGNTALIEAATNGYPDIASLLLKHGADENTKNRKTGRIAPLSSDVVQIFDGYNNPKTLNKKLITAASEGKARLVGGLITAGADMNTREVKDCLSFQESSMAINMLVMRINQSQKVKETVNKLLLSIAPRLHRVRRGNTKENMQSCKFSF